MNTTEQNANKQLPDSSDCIEIMKKSEEVDRTLRSINPQTCREVYHSPCQRYILRYHDEYRLYFIEEVNRQLLILVWRDVKECDELAIEYFLQDFLAGKDLYSPLSAGTS
jgi:hypothetical protein